MNDCQTCGDEVPIVALLCESCRPHSFDELDEQAKKYAREQYISGDYPGYDWWDATFEDADRMAKLLGIEIDNIPERGLSIQFSGFWSQGDGASFNGVYRPNHTAVADIKRDTNDEELIRIAEALAAIQVTLRLLKREITWVDIRARGYYSHSHCMTTEINYDYQDEEVPIAFEDDLTQLMRDFADWIYEQLQAEYDYLCSDEYVDEQLREEKFDVHGIMI